LSNAKDITYAKWNRFDVRGTLKLVWSEYDKKKDEIDGHVVIPEPTICQ
jgi:hypothetical protein